MEIIEIDGLSLTVIRSQRKTLCMRIADDGRAEVLAPRRISDKQLRETVAPYVGKLKCRREEVLERMESRKEFAPTYGDSMRFLGEERIIKAGEDGYVKYDELGFYVPQGLDSEQVRDAVIRIYKLAAKEYLTERVAELAPLLGCDVKAVKINSAVSHWASCSRRDTLNFSWYCVMAKPDAVDYIIIHELCHMYEFNHSARFWALVQQYCPNYKKHRTYLKELWREIEHERWK